MQQMSLDLRLCPPHPSAQVICASLFHHLTAHMGKTRNSFILYIVSPTYVSETLIQESASHSQWTTWRELAGFRLPPLSIVFVFVFLYLLNFSQRGVVFFLLELISWMINLLIGCSEPQRTFVREILSLRSCLLW